MCELAQTPLPRVSVMRLEKRPAGADCPRRGSKLARDNPVYNMHRPTFASGSPYKDMDEAVAWVKRCPKRIEHRECAADHAP
jgi:hypothetical protein